MDNKIRQKIINDLMTVQLKDTEKKNKDEAVALISKIVAGDYNNTRRDFPVSRLHAQLLVIGDTEILYKLERGGY